MRGIFIEIFTKNIRLVYLSIILNIFVFCVIILAGEGGASSASILPAYLIYR